MAQDEQEKPPRSVMGSPQPELSFGPIFILDFRFSIG
jgi:hypothetical protein